MNTTASTTVEMRLHAIRYAAQDTHLYEFRRLDGAPLPGVEPGAHIDLHLPNGMMRQYSLCTADGDPRAYVVGVKRDRASRGGSRYIHEYLQVGEILQVGGPRNNFPLKDDAGHSVLIAGGIGVTPIWCMAQRLLKLGRSFELHYACRTRKEAAFLEELAALPQAKLHFDDEAGGFLDLAPVVSQAPAGAHFYCCGPLPMLAGFEAATKSLPPGQVHVEYFSAKEEAATGGGHFLSVHHQRRTHARRPARLRARIVDGQPHAARDDLGIGEDVSHGIDRPRRHAQPIQRGQQLRAGESAEERMEHGVERIAVAHAVLVGEEARIVGEVGRAQRLA